MKRSLFLMLLVFGALVLGCNGAQLVDRTPTPPPPTAEQPATAVVEVITPGPQPATPTPIIVTATPPPTVTPKPRQAVERNKPTPTPTIPGLWLVDNFENPDNNGEFDAGLWTLHPDKLTSVEQNNGFLTVSRESSKGGGLDHKPLKIEQIGFFEAKVMLDSKMQASEIGDISIHIHSGDWYYDWWLICGIAARPNDSVPGANCYTSDGFAGNWVEVPDNSWHTVRFEVDSNTAAVSFFVDDVQIGLYVPPDPEAFKQTQVMPGFRVWSEGGGLVTGYIDDVRVGKAQAEVSEVDPALYDDFNDERYEGTINPEKWATTVEQSSGQIEQQQGKLILSFIPGTDITSIDIGTDEAFGLNELDFMEAEIYLSTETVKEGYGEISTGLYTPLNNSQDLVFSCSIYKNESSAEVGCEVWVFDKSNSNNAYQPEYASEKKPTSFDTPHIVRIEVDPEANVTFYIDNQSVGSHKPNRAAEVKDKDSKPTLWIVRNNQSGLTAYVDHVRIGRLGQP